MKKVYAVKKVIQLGDAERRYERKGTLIIHDSGRSGVLFLELGDGVKHELALFEKTERPVRNPEPPIAEAWSKALRERGLMSR